MRVSTVERKGGEKPKAVAAVTGVSRDSRIALDIRHMLACGQSYICMVNITLSAKDGTPLLFVQYTQYELYGIGYMGRIFGRVENMKKIRDMTSLHGRKYGTGFYQS